MAKTKSPAIQRSRAATRHPADAERWSRTLIVGGVIAVVLIAFGFIAFGWYQTQIRPLGKTVLQVGDTKYSLGHLERRMELELQNNQAIAQDPNRLFALPDQVMQELEFEATLLEAGPSLGIEVTDADVAAEVRDRAGLAEDAPPAELSAALRQQVRESGLHESEYRRLVRGELMALKVRDYFSFLAPSAEPQVKARWIVVEDPGRAEEALAKVQAGEDFDAVALEYAANRTAIERDFSPRGSVLLPPEVEDFFFEAEPSSLSEVVSFQDQYYIAELQERDESRPLDDNQRQLVGQREMTRWIQEQNATLEIRRNLSQEDAVRALEDVVG